MIISYDGVQLKRFFSTKKTKQEKNACTKEENEREKVPSHSTSLHTHTHTHIYTCISVHRPYSIFTCRVIPLFGNVLTTYTYL